MKYTLVLDLDETLVYYREVFIHTHLLKESFIFQRQEKEQENFS